MNIRLLFEYFRIHIKSIILFTAFSAVFLTVFLLAGIPAAPVAYAALLCAVLALFVTAAGFVRFCRRHRALVTLREAILVSDEVLPPPANLTEDDYQRLIKLLFADKCRIESEKDAALEAAADYYTLWAHQIKTPISALRLMLADSPDKSVREQLFRIEQYVEMALRYAHTEQGNSDYVLRSYDIDEVIKPVFRKFAPSFMYKNITLDYTPVGFSAVTDEKWLGFVIGQVLSNSLKYTKNDGKISVYASPDYENTIVISDNGIGISPADLPLVCEKGYTGYNGRADKQSTGIGLYLCKKILGKLGHGIRLESKVGTGTRVYITLDSQPVSD